jgi:hypothetical protein
MVMPNIYSGNGNAALFVPPLIVLFGYYYPPGAMLFQPLTHNNWTSLFPKSEPG